MNIYEKLLAIQNELKAPKNQYNKFGGYAYRNCEDILEALKPLTKKNKASLVITDKIVQSGERFYVEASAILIDVEKPEDRIVVQAYARESDDKKGMDLSQITGATSSYARKYALNGLFNIDDNKDADSMDNTEKPKEEKPKVRTPEVKIAHKEVQPEGKISNDQITTLKGLLTPEREPKLLEYFKVSKIEELTAKDFVEALAILQSAKK